MGVIGITLEAHQVTVEGFGKYPEITNPQERVDFCCFALAQLYPDHTEAFWREQIEKTARQIGAVTA